MLHIDHIHPVISLVIEFISLLDCSDQYKQENPYSLHDGLKVCLLLICIQLFILFCSLFLLLIVFILPILRNGLSFESNISFNTDQVFNTATKFYSHLKFELYNFSKRSHTMFTNFHLLNLYIYIAYTYLV